MQLLLRTQPLQKSTHPLENARTAAGRLGVASRAARLPTSNVAHAPASRLSPSSPLPAPGKFWRLSLSAQHTALRALSASHLERRRRREPLPRPRGPARGRREGRPLEVPAALLRVPYLRGNEPGVGSVLWVVGARTPAPSRLCLGCVSAVSRLCLGCVSAVSRLCLGCVSAVSRPVGRPPPEEEEPTRTIPPGYRIQCGFSPVGGVVAKRALTC